LGLSGKEKACGNIMLGLLSEITLYIADTYYV
jgi:hypothetical protein